MADSGSQKNTVPVLLKQFCLILTQNKSQNPISIEKSPAAIAAVVSTVRLPSSSHWPVPEAVAVAAQAGFCYWTKDSSALSSNAPAETPPVSPILPAGLDESQPAERASAKVRYILSPYCT